MILIVFKCQNSSLDYFDTVKKFIEKLMDQSIMTKSLTNARRRQSDNTGFWSDEMKKNFVNAPHWSIAKWISVLAKGGGQKKRFEYCLDPNYPRKFLYLRAIQGRSGSTINLALQDNVLLPKGFYRVHFPLRERS